MIWGVSPTSIGSYRRCLILWSSPTFILGIPAEASGPSVSLQLSGAWPPKAKAYLGPVKRSRFRARFVQCVKAVPFFGHPLHIFTYWIHKRIQYPVPTQMSQSARLYFNQLRWHNQNWTATEGANWTDPLNFILSSRHCKTSNRPLTPAQLQQTNTTWYTTWYKPHQTAFLCGLAMLAMIPSTHVAGDLSNQQKCSPLQSITQHRCRKIAWIQTHWPQSLRVEWLACNYAKTRYLEFPK